MTAGQSRLRIRTIAAGNAVECWFAFSNLALYRNRGRPISCVSGHSRGNLRMREHLSHPAVRPVRRTGALLPIEADKRAFALFGLPLMESGSPTLAGVASAGPQGTNETPRNREAANQPHRRSGPSAGAIATMDFWQKRDIALRPKKTILCVDDNEQILSVRTFLLETRGYRVISTLTPHQALEVIEQSVPGSLDLLLADLNMPQMDGNELVRRAKQLHPALPAMIVSGSITAFDRACAADVFLPKGACSPAEMIERIRVLVARKRGPKKAHISPGILLQPAVAS